MKPLPPKWIGPILVLSGFLGLIFTVSPRAAGIALIVVVLAFCLLSAFGALVAANRADDALAKYQAEAGASEYARQCMERIRRDEAEVAAAAVIGDDFPARGSATELQHRGGDQGSASDTATPGAISANSQDQCPANRAARPGA